MPVKVSKAVILAAGWGTRFLPATKSQPKEMLPLVDKPVVQYVVEEAVASGIDFIVMVTAAGKRAVEDHFDRAFALEEALRQKGDAGLLENLHKISNLAEICYVRQKEQLGVGHAVLSAARLVGDEPFALIFPDDVIESEVPVIKQLCDAFLRYQYSVIAVQQVPEEEIRKYGIIAADKIADRIYKIRGLVEKPEPKDAPSNLGIVGRYILTPDIFGILRRTPLGKSGEIQLTDGLQLLLEQQPIYGYEFEGIRYDTGNPLGLIKASIDIALRRDDIGPQLRDYLRGLEL